ncbi:MAG: PP2C family protein-serine/threonine phosphatase [Candidatus Hodarchaeales archaeon]|jgi:sigma-B regulation protein RsbU (phosphoserine phosphatase)
MSRDTDDDKFITLFYAVLDEVDQSVIWASGGHDPAFWYHKSSGKIEELPNTGLPVGLMEDASFGQAGLIYLEKGDIVVIGTDGIWEAQNTSGEFLAGKDFLR